ncbi:GPR1/FUN34/yaaH family protein [Russula earlei]|uniref:GPR1/FUN34/yaaH family protein n=1 Tax=Russula earlei TaxID=71964 RepID=A0ACC0TQP4_9AGAM|nr:GPR1/FUN34/yaaH family protein [Russula earlei]
MNTANNTTNTVIKDTTANPAPLGLLGFGMTTVLLNLHNAGFFELNSMIMGMGIFMGGIAQIFAGLQEWKKNNTFGATAFTAYGAFWLSLVALWLIPKTSFGTAYASSEAGIAWYLLLWGVFTFFMFIGTLRLNRTLQVIFFTLTVLFFLLAASAFTENKSLHTFAGYEGIVCGLSAMYGCFAQILNEVYGKTVLPLGVRE